MARAKRTGRADARRRYRQVQLGDVDAPEMEDEAPAAAPAHSQKGPSASSERPSLTAAFRNAYRPANVREDIAALPWLIRSRSFLLSIVLVIGGTIAVAAAPTNDIASLLFQALVVPPAMAPIFIVGFFAKRASYLLGLLISLVDVAAYAAFIYLVAPGLASDPIDPAQQQGLVISALSVGPLSGIFFAASAAWYRRFLALSNANAANRARAKAQQRARAGKAARG